MKILYIQLVATHRSPSSICARARAFACEVWNSYAGRLTPSKIPLWNQWELLKVQCLLFVCVCRSRWSAGRGSADAAPGRARRSQKSTLAETARCRRHRSPACACHRRSTEALYGAADLPPRTQRYKV